MTSAGRVHLLPKMRKRPRFGLRVYGGHEISRRRGLLAVKRSHQQAERQDYSNSAISFHHWIRPLRFYRQAGRDSFEAAKAIRNLGPDILDTSDYTSKPHPLEPFISVLEPSPRVQASHSGFSDGYIVAAKRAYFRYVCRSSG